MRLIDLADQHSNDPDYSQNSDDEFGQAAKKSFRSTRPVNSLISHSFFSKIVDFLFAKYFVGKVVHGEISFT